MYPELPRDALVIQYCCRPGCKQFLAVKRTIIDAPGGVSSIPWGAKRPARLVAMLEINGWREMDPDRWVCPTDQRDGDMGKDPKDTSWFKTCPECGVVIVNYELHQKFHDDLAAVVSTYLAHIREDHINDDRQPSRGASGMGQATGAPPATG